MDKEREERKKRPASYYVSPYQGSYSGYQLYQDIYTGQQFYQHVVTGHRVYLAPPSPPPSPALPPPPPPKPETVIEVVQQSPGDDEELDFLRTARLIRKADAEVEEFREQVYRNRDTPHFDEHAAEARVEAFKQAVQAALYEQLRRMEEKRK